MDSQPEQAGPGPAPTDAYQWRESVLSTRSLSYISTVPDDHESPDVSSSDPYRPSPRRSSIARIPSYGFGNNLARTRRNTLMSMSSMGDDDNNNTNNIQEESEEDDEETLEVAQRRRHHHKTQIRQEEMEQTPTSPLLSLPFELRQLIFSYALSPSSALVEIPWPTPTLQSHLHPALLRTNRQIHAEASRILYTTTNLSFAHPSDANMFRRALASPLYAPLLPHFTLRIASSDAKLWTSYFHSTSPERSLVKDFPNLQSLTIRYVGLRYDTRFEWERNAIHWLRDDRLQEVILAVRKCCDPGRTAKEDQQSAVAAGGPPVIRVRLCVVLPHHLPNEPRPYAGIRCHPGNPAAEDSPGVIFFRDSWKLGCFIKVEPVEREGMWM